MLATRQQPSPSVVLFRHGTERRPEQQASLLLANLEVVTADLEQGSIVVIDPGRLRVRQLPFQPDARRTLRFAAKDSSEVSPPRHSDVAIAMAGGRRSRKSKQSCGRRRPDASSWRFRAPRDLESARLLRPESSHPGQ
ncbi:MAG: hypothetical protein ACXVFQ_23475 [Solirubrobacteraceae bacterium]